MKLEKLKNDSDGAVGGKVLLVFIVVLALALLTLSGYLSFNLPGDATDEFTERVVRGATDTGMVVPIKIELTFDQDADATSQKATVNAYVKHKQTKGSDGNYVPDPDLVSVVEFNTKVGNVDDSATIYSMNGNTFVASNVTYNSSLMSVTNTNFGYPQNNYKVWTTGTTYTPPSSVGTTSKDNSALLIQTEWIHYRKGTNEEIGSDIVNWIVYYGMPAYNVDNDYTASYTYNVYVPFNNYAGEPSTSSALVEDIKCKILSYYESCKIEWQGVELVTHTYWDFPVLNKFFPGISGTIKLVSSTDSIISTRITYDWRGPTVFSLDNSAKYGSHTYQYKIR